MRANAIISASVLISFLASQPGLALEYGKKARTTGPLTVALIPFSEAPSPGLDKLIRNLQRQLDHRGNLRTLDQSRTQEVIGYYLEEVRSQAHNTGAVTEMVNARQKYRDHDYAGAEKLLNQAAAILEKKTASGQSNEGLADVYLLKANIDHFKGVRGEKNYERILSLNPDFKLDPKLYRPSQVKEMEEARRRMEGDLSASLRVTSTPQGSDVFLNGFNKGITPVVLSHLAAGKHVLEVRSVNHAPVVRTVELKKGESSNADMKLSRISVPAEKKAVTIRPSQYPTENEISKLIMGLSYHLGVDKVILVADKREAGVDSVVYRLGDAHLGAVQREHQFSITSDPSDKEIVSLVTGMKNEAKRDILLNPGKYADQTVGSVELLQKKKKPFYKQPLFWVLVGATAATGATLGAVLGGGSAAAAAGGGVFIGF